MLAITTTERIEKIDQPLTNWYCDVCGEKIEDPKQGYVVWKSTDGLKEHGFKIIHQSKCDSKKNYPASAALTDFLGDQGLAYLLSMLSIGPIKVALGQGSYCQVSDTDEFVDFMRRVQTPFYEEARRHFGNRDLVENYSDSNEVAPYFPDDLKKIIKSYG